MGRRRSKTQKQKHVRAASNKVSKAFAKKLGVGGSKSNLHHGGGDMKIDVSVSFKSTKPTMSSSSSLSIDKINSSQKQPKKHQQQQPPDAASVPLRDDFLKQHRSLREREMQIEWKRNLSSKTSSGRNHYRRRNTAKQVEKVLQFAAASLLVDDPQKGVDQLVVETAAKVRNFTLDGDSSTPLPATPQPTPFSTPKSAPNQPPSMWNANDNGDTATLTVETNPWAVLADDDDDDDDDDDNHQPQAKSPQTKAATTMPLLFAASRLNLQPFPTARGQGGFCFAPPTFFAPSSSNTRTSNDTGAAFGGNVDLEDDPDL